MTIDSVTIYILRKVFVKRVLQREKKLSNQSGKGFHKNVELLRLKKNIVQL